MSQLRRLWAWLNQAQRAREDFYERVEQLRLNADRIDRECRRLDRELRRRR